jgi:hypothetical protein
MCAFRPKRTSEQTLSSIGVVTAASPLRRQSGMEAEDSGPELGNQAGPFHRHSAAMLPGQAATRSMASLMSLGSNGFLRESSCEDFRPGAKFSVPMTPFAMCGTKHKISRFAVENGKTLREDLSAQAESIHLRDAHDRLRWY